MVFESKLFFSLIALSFESHKLAWVEIFGFVPESCFFCFLDRVGLVLFTIYFKVAQ